MVSQYSIRILDAPGGTVVFWPWLPGTQPGAPLIAAPGDLVTWNNTSASAITLVSLDPTVTYITNPIPSGQVSSPIFTVPAKGLTYETSDGKVKHSIQVPSAVLTAPSV